MSLGGTKKEMNEEEKNIRARIRANERLAREYEEIGDISGSLRCKARAEALKFKLARTRRTK